MQIPEETWEKYLEVLDNLNEDAYQTIYDYLDNLNYFKRDITPDDIYQFMNFAYGVDEYYGSAASAWVCQMYEEVATLQGAVVPPPLPIDPYDYYGNIASAINATIKTGNIEEVSSAVGRVVKLMAEDTNLYNAIRAKAQVAWVPNGDTCAYCIAKAAEGWHQASHAELKNGHAKHIHSNCDCTFAIRFDKKLNIEGYDYVKYNAMYRDSPGKNSRQKINSLRREFYHENSEKINEQKRIAYAKRKERESSAAEEYDVN